MFGRNGESPVPVIAPRSPADCFDAALDAVRIATTYRTPVLLLSDGYLANGSEPWRIPDVAGLPDLQVEFATAPNATDTAGSPVFRPFDRDPDTLARPWAVPGTAGLEHRIGGIEKADGTGEISYDPDNHDLMTRLRQAKIDGIETSHRWRSTIRMVTRTSSSSAGGRRSGRSGPAARLARGAGTAVATAHLRNLNPFPANTGDVLRRYRRVLVPEMNLGQLALLLRARYLVDAQGYNRVRGLPFTSIEIAEAITKLAQKDAS